MHGGDDVAGDTGDLALEVIGDGMQDLATDEGSSFHGFGEVAPRLVGGRASGIGLVAFALRDFERLAQRPDQPAQRDRLNGRDQAVQQHPVDLVAVEKDGARHDQAEGEVMQNDGGGRRNEDAPVQPAGEHRQHGEKIHVHVGLIGMPGEGIDQQHDLAHGHDAGNLAGHPAGAVDAPDHCSERCQRDACQPERGAVQRSGGWCPDRQHAGIGPEDRDQETGEALTKTCDGVHRPLPAGLPVQSLAKAASMTSQAPAP